MTELAAEERKAIASLERLASRWPPSLMLASMGGRLVVVPTADHMSPQPDSDGMDPDKVLAWISGIPNDGGDW